MTTAAAALQTAPMKWTNKEADWRMQGVPCSCCGKEIKVGKPTFFVHVIDGGARVLHPTSEAGYTQDAGEMGLHPVGPECAKKFGKGFALTIEDWKALPTFVPA